MVGWRGTNMTYSYRATFNKAQVVMEPVTNGCFLHRMFSLDDLLTNVMIYWTTGSIVSSMRFYKENFKSNPDKRVDAKYVAKCC